MNSYEKITEARKVLELGERATMEEIKSQYRNLISEWHPDRCHDNKEKCAEMTRRIIDAYETIIMYCDRYVYSFKEEDVGRALSPEEWWAERFGGSFFGSF